MKEHAPFVATKDTCFGVCLRFEHYAVWYYSSNFVKEKGSHLHSELVRNHLAFYPSYSFLTIYVQGRISLFFIVILYPENCRHRDSKEYFIYLVSLVRLIVVLMSEIIILLSAKIYTYAMRVVKGQVMK